MNIEVECPACGSDMQEVAEPGGPAVLVCMKPSCRCRIPLTGELEEAGDGGTLRDEIAMRAMDSLLHGMHGRPDPEQTADFCYRMADAMLARREASAGQAYADGPQTEATDGA